MPPAITLADRVAIVTGGRRQLGAAQAIRLAECGADVCLADLDHDDSMTATAAAIERLGRRALTVVCDLRRRDQVERMVEACAAELGGVDIRASRWTTPTWSRSSPRISGPTSRE